MRLVNGLAAGLLALHLLLLLHGLGMRWNVLSVALTLAVALVAAWGVSRRVTSPEETDRATGFPGWGDAVAVLTVLIFAIAAWTFRATHPDFVYHWGIKAKKFLLAGGLDLVYLGHDWNHFIHPDYPTLIPELYAVTSLLTGGFAEPVSLLWSVVFFAGMLLALRETMARRLIPAWSQAALAFLALGLSAFAIGQRLAGGADLALGFAFAAALPALLASDSERPESDDLALGLAAGLAAAVKLEGVLLAAGLVGIHQVQRLVQKRLGWAVCVRAALPSLLVIGPWLAICLRHGLFQSANSGPFEIDRWPTVAAALGEAMAVRPWHGLSYLILATPLLLLFRRTRGLAAVILLQLAFYLWNFFTQVADPEVLIRSSAPRLLLPLVPAVIVGLLVVSAGRDQNARTSASPHRSKGRFS